MEQIMNYVKPELLVVAVVLYFVGMGLKKAQYFANRHIPLALGILGCLLASLYVFGTSNIGNPQEISMAVFTAFVQGVLVAGLSTYVDQIIKQLNKEE